MPPRRVGTNVRGAHAPLGTERMFDPRRPAGVSSWGHARLPPRRPVPAHRRPAPGDQGAGRRPRPRPARPDAAGRDRHREDVRDGRDHHPGQQADARPRPQQDAGGPAVLGVPGVLPGQRRRVLRQLLRLLPARGLPAPVGHVHREGLLAQRGDRPPASRRDPRAVRAARRDHRRLGLVHLRPGQPRSTTAPRSCGSRSAASTGATRCSVTSSTSSTSATTPRSRARASACAGTPSRSARRRPRRSSGSSSSATRSSGSPSSIRSPASCSRNARSSTSTRRPTS